MRGVLVDLLSDSRTPGHGLDPLGVQESPPKLHVVQASNPSARLLPRELYNEIVRFPAEDSRGGWLQMKGNLVFEL